MPNIHLRRDIPPVRAWLMAPPFDDGDVSLSFSRLLDFLGAIESGPVPTCMWACLRERACLFMRSWYVGCCHVAAPQRELPVPRGCVTTTDFTKIKEEHARRTASGGTVASGGVSSLAEGEKPSPVLGWRPQAGCSPKPQAKAACSWRWAFCFENRGARNDAGGGRRRVRWTARSSPPSPSSPRLPPPV